MTDINDLYEVNDREPGEPDDEHQEPVSLDEVAELLRRAENAFSRFDQEKAERDLIEVVVPQMIDEIGDLRLRIAEWEALPTRIEIVCANGDDPDKAGLVIPFDSYVKAAEHADKTPGCKVFYRWHHLRVWQEPIDSDAPF